jgi:integrase
MEPDPFGRALSVCEWVLGLSSTCLRRGEALALLGDVNLTNGLLRVCGTLSRVNGHLVISEPKTERSRRDVPLSPATVVLLRSVKARQGAERLKVASTWVETGLVFTTESGTEVDPGTHCGRSAPRPRLWA